jgi:CO dehydrogenase/acetyl-CoA synthase gamma subunit (corrinoid Fe-S protein)
MLLEKIENFDIFRPKMDATKEVLHAIATFTVDILPCIAYAAALREGEIRLEDCPPLGEEKFREKQIKLQAYLESFGWRALDAE